MIAKMLNKNFTAKGTLDWIYEYASGDLVVTLSVAYSSELETCFYTQILQQLCLSVTATKDMEEVFEEDYTCLHMTIGVYQNS